MAYCFKCGGTYLAGNGHRCPPNYSDELSRPANTCPHGQLPRSCETCVLITELAEVTKQRDEAVRLLRSIPLFPSERSQHILYLDRVHALLAIIDKEPTK